MTTSEYRLHVIARIAGYGSVDELLMESTSESVCPGLFVRCEDVIDDCEPDAEANWCEECSTPTVQSALVLAGLI